jgi:hypothetical protein
VILDTTTRSIEALLAATATTQPTFVVSLTDITTTSFTPGSSTGALNSTTAVTLVAAPAASTQRQVKFISIYNGDSVSHTLTIQYNDNGTIIPLLKTSIAVGAILYWTPETGWSGLSGSLTQVWAFAASDEVTPLTASTGKITFRAPTAFVLVAVKASLVTAQTSGSLLTVDVKLNGTSIFSTLLTFDNTETTTETAATPAVLSTTAISDDDIIRVDVTQVGSGDAAGLKVYMKGYMP